MLVKKEGEKAQVNLIRPPIWKNFYIVQVFYKPSCSSQLHLQQEWSYLAKRVLIMIFRKSNNTVIT